MSDSDNTGTAADIFRPARMAKSGDTLYIVKQTQDIVKAITLSTKQVHTIVRKNGSGIGYRNGNGNQAVFNNPRGIAVSGAKLYIADMLNYRIREVEIGATLDATVVRDFAGAEER